MSAVPKAVVSWSLAGNIVTYDSIDQQGFPVIFSSLTVDMVPRSLGSLTCAAENEHGSDQKTFNIVVYCKYCFKSYNV